MWNVEYMQMSNQTMFKRVIKEIANGSISLARQTFHLPTLDLVSWFPETYRSLTVHFLWECGIRSHYDPFIGLTSSNDQ